MKTKEEVLQYVFKKYGVNIEGLKSKSRKEPIATARGVAMCLFHKKLNIHFNEIGLFFNRSRSMAYCAHKKYKNYETKESEALKIGVSNLYSELVNESIILEAKLKVIKDLIAIYRPITN